MKLFLFFVLAVCYCEQTLSSEYGVTFSSNITDSNIKFDLSWEHSDAVDNRWIAIGLGENMESADIWICKVHNGATSCEDYTSNSFALPQLDTSVSGTADLENITGSFVSGNHSFTFSRTLITVDDTDFNLEADTEVNALWAFGELDSQGVPNQHS